MLCVYCVIVFMYKLVYTSIDVQLNFPLILSYAIVFFLFGAGVFVVGILDFLIWL